MKQLLINLKDYKQSKLPYITYTILQIINEKGNLKDWFDDIDYILTDLEYEEYIKIIDMQAYEVEPREKLVSLFKRTETNSQAIQVLIYLNEKLKSKNPNKRGFDLNSNANLKFIKARLQAGYTIEDMKNVIDKKFKDWYGTQMQQFLRPETLFNDTKFQSYINEIGTNKTWSNLV